MAQDEGLFVSDDVHWIGTTACALLHIRKNTTQRHLSMFRVICQQDDHAHLAAICASCSSEIVSLTM